MMLPIAIDLARVPVALIGRGPRALRRLAQFEADGVARVRIFSDAPSPDLAAAAGERLVPRLPDAADLAGSRVVFVADLAPEETGDVASAAYSAGALVNVEDQRGWCDFHTPALVRRGDLTIAISTNGRSPALARRLREYLEALFAPSWAQRVARLAALRRRLREAGADGTTISRASDDMIEREDWLPEPAAPARPYRRAVGESPILVYARAQP